MPADATPEQKDEHWFKHVYVGDKMPQLTLRAVLTGDQQTKFDAMSQGGRGGKKKN